MLNEAEYALQPGDSVKLLVYGESQLSGEYRIDQHGFISVPLIERIQATGSTTRKLQETIREMLVKGGFMAKPRITVDILSLRPFYIAGEVKNPGGYPWQPSLDMQKAIALAGGYSPRAARNLILLDRGEVENKARYNATESTPVLPGDSITVRERIF